MKLAAFACSSTKLKSSLYTVCMKCESIQFPLCNYCCFTCYWFITFKPILQKRWKPIQHHHSPFTTTLFSFRAFTISSGGTSSWASPRKSNDWTIGNPASACREWKKCSDIKECQLDGHCRIVSSCGTCTGHVFSPVTMLQKKAIGWENRKETWKICLQ